MPRKRKSDIVVQRCEDMSKKLAELDPMVMMLVAETKSTVGESRARRAEKTKAFAEGIQDVIRIFEAQSVAGVLLEVNLWITESLSILKSRGTVVYRQDGRYIPEDEMDDRMTELGAVYEARTKLIHTLSTVCDCMVSKECTGDGSGFCTWNAEDWGMWKKAMTRRTMARLANEMMLSTVVK